MGFDLSLVFEGDEIVEEYVSYNCSEFSEYFYVPSSMIYSWDGDHEDESYGLGETVARELKEALSRMKKDGYSETYTPLCDQWGCVDRKYNKDDKLHIRDRFHFFGQILEDLLKYSEEYPEAKWYYS